MISPYCERAITEALEYNSALLKYISANDVGLTNSHQYGFYLPAEIWNIFTPYPPTRGQNFDHPVVITWQDGRVTDSMIKWYGTNTRYEYRLTRFGKDFPFRTYDNLGDLLVLIPKSHNEISAYVLDLEDDISEIQSVLGVELIRSWAIYRSGDEFQITEDVCLRNKFRTFAESVSTLPNGNLFSETTREAILECLPGFESLSSDEKLLKLYREEYNLYKMVERKIFQPQVCRLFTSIDEFLETAMTIFQTRKPRAGRSLENHVEYLFQRSGIPFQMRQSLDNTKPDIVIPDKAAYDNPSYPSEKLFIIGVKTTCKDRWRQVTREAPRISKKYILTLQGGISINQLQEMQQTNVKLIVPKPLHNEYPSIFRSTLYSIDQFIELIQKEIAL